MTDPISAAIAGNVAAKATEKILGYIESADDPEEAWQRAGLEVAIQIETFYRQNIEDGKMYKSSKVKKEIGRYGELSQELAIRGDLRGFDTEKVETLEEFGYACASFIDRPFGAGMELEELFQDELGQYIEEIKTGFN
jgi:hypothetical protein